MVQRCVGALLGRDWSKVDSGRGSESGVAYSDVGCSRVESAEGHERTDRAVVIDGRRNDEVVESVLYRDYDSVTGQQGPDRLDGCPGVMGLHGR